jgi:uncharacterized delta-60 repeat protein
MKKIILFTVLLIATCTRGIFAQNNALDPSFGENGIVNIPVEDVYSEMAWAIAVQSDGKIIQGGYKGQYSCLKRHNDDGSLDTSFGNMGVVNSALPNLPLYSSGVIYSIALQSDGRIIAGMSVDNGDYMVIARYNTNGTLDTSFGTDGITVIDLYANIMGAPDEMVENIQVQADGKIVLTARMYNGSYNTNMGYIAKFDANGAMDATFGFGYGITTPELGQGWVQTGAVQQDGKVLILATPYINNNSVSAIARYSADGTLDTTFGDMGIKIVTGGLSDFFCRDMLVQPDGKIVIGGQAEVTSGLITFCFARLDTNGNFDNGFGINGISLYNSGLPGFTDKIALQADGKIVAAGRYGTNSFGFMRCNINGTVDTNFGTNGGIQYYAVSSSDFISGTAVQPDGKIVVGGTSYPPGNPANFMLMRYLNDSTANILENTFNNLAVYPNPAQNTLYLQNPENTSIESLLVTDVTGKTVLQETGNISQIDISPLPQGMYFLKVTSGSGSTNLKFIKQ